MRPDVDFTVDAYARRDDGAKYRVLVACQEAGVPVPQEVLDYFGVAYPEDVAYGGLVLVDIGKSLKGFEDEYASGYEIELSSLPPEVSVLRVVTV